MAGRYDRVSGAYCKVKKRYVRISGAWTPVKKRFDKANGVWVPSYSSGIEWTYGLSIDGSDCSGYVEQNYTLRLYSGNGSPGSGNAAIAVFTFSSPIKICAGQTIEMLLDADNTNGDDHAGFDIRINDNSLCLLSISTYAGYLDTQTWQAASDTLINNIRVVVSLQGSHAYEARMRMTIHSEAGSFLLNNSGSFES